MFLPDSHIDFEDVLGPMEAVSRMFYGKVIKPGFSSSDPRYRNALFHLLVSQTSCYRYWGQDLWTGYGREICRPAVDILASDLQEHAP